MAYSHAGSIDLHIHSDASDGTDTPSQIVATALSRGLKAIAITDHDTTDGSKKVLNAGLPPSLNFLTGVEISAIPPKSFPCSGSFHILGYGIDLEDPVLTKTLETLQDARKTRNPRILEKLNRFGFDISTHEVAALAGNGQMGRPHIAQIMVKKGFVPSINTAFDKFLAKGKPAYVDKYRIDSRRAIEVIHHAGGLPFLAHPGLIGLPEKLAIEDLIARLKKEGLEGIEVYYPEHSEKQTSRYLDIARRHALLISGGTDYHGSIKPEIEMGIGRGKLSVPYELYHHIASQIDNKKT